MTMTKPVQVYVSSVLKARRNIPPPPIQRAAPPAPALVGPPQLTKRRADSNAAVAKIFRSYPDPCLDLFYNVIPASSAFDSWYHSAEYLPMRNSDADSQQYLKQVLPRAWAHSPLTTLKLICNFLDRRSPTGKDYCPEFYTETFNAAADWLHQNHPRTLAHNLPSVAGYFGDLTTALGILYRALQNGAPIADLKSEIRKGLGGLARSPARRKKVLELANRAVEKYQIDPDYRFLHDLVSDLFADCLKSDIQTLIGDGDGGKSNWLEISEAAKWCPYIDSVYDRATLLCESIARKVFPPAESDGGAAEKEAEYAFRARHRLRTEVLAPLRAALEESSGARSVPCPAKKYLADVAAGNREIDPAALLPNEIVRYVNDGEVGGAAEVQWKAMVQEVYAKQGKFKNFLAVGDGDYYVESVEEGREVVTALQAMMTELCDEPWRGKAVNLRGRPRIELIPGNGDLKSKIEFFRSDRGWIGLDKVFDLILEAAVAENLKPEQMIKKVFVFSCTSDGAYDEWFSQFKRESWEWEAAAIRKKFEEKGYVVPEVVFWNAIRSARPAPVITNDDGAVVDYYGKEMYRPFIGEGAVLMGGFNDNLFKTFLANDGGFTKKDVMESAISGQEYQDLVVVD